MFPTTNVLTTEQAQLRLAVNCFIAQNIKGDSLDRKVMRSAVKLYFGFCSFGLSLFMGSSRGDAENFATLPENLITKRITGSFCAVSLEASSDAPCYKLNFTVS